jgi:hypothetical protein
LETSGSVYNEASLPPRIRPDPRPGLGERRTCVHPARRSATQDTAAGEGSRRNTSDARISRHRRRFLFLGWTGWGHPIGRYRDPAPGRRWNARHVHPGACVRNRTPERRRCKATRNGAASVRQHGGGSEISSRGELLEVPKLATNELRLARLVRTYDLADLFGTAMRGSTPRATDQIRELSRQVSSGPHVRCDWVAEIGRQSHPRAWKDSGVQTPNSSLSVRPVVALAWVMARSSALFFGCEKPCAVPL